MARLEIEVVGKGDDVLALLQRITQATEKLADDVGQVGKKGGEDSGTALQKIETQLNKLGQLPGPIGAGMRTVADAFGAAGTAGELAGTGTSIAFGPVTVIIALITAAVAALVAAFAGLLVLAGKAIEAASDWGKAVEGIQEVSGMTAEYASTLAHVGEIAGVTPDQIEQMAAASARITYDANEQLKKIAEDTEAAKQRAAERTVEAESDHAARVTDINTAAADKRAQLDQAAQRTADNARIASQQREQQYDDAVAELRRAGTERLSDLERQHAERVGDLRKSLAQTETEYEREAADRMRDYNERRADEASQLTQRLNDLSEQHAQREQDLNAQIADNAAQLTDRLTQLAESHAQRIEDLEASIDDTRESYDQRRQDRAERLEEQLAQMDERNANKRESLQANLSSARDKYERAAMQAELEAFDQQTAEEKAKLQQKADEQEAKAKADEDKAIAKIQARIDRENKVYEDQTARLKAENEKRLADLNERIARENTAYAEQTARLKSEDEKRADDEVKALLRARVSAAEDHDQRVADLNERITRENTAYAKQTADQNAEQERRLASLKTGYDRDTANAQRAFDEQTAAYITSRQRIQAEQDKSLADADKAYHKSLDGIQTALNDFMKQAEQATPPAVKAVQALGLEWDSFIKLDADQRMDALLTALGKMPDSADKAAIEMKVLGRSGRDINDVAEVYATKTLPEWIVQTKIAGKLMSEDMVNGAVNATRAHNSLIASLSGIGVTLGSDLMPAWNTFLTKLQELWEKHGPAITRFLERVITDLLPKLIELIGQLADGLDRIMGGQGAAAQQQDMLHAAGGVVAGLGGSSPIGVLGTLLQMLTGAQKRAAGGPVQAGQVYQVNEPGVADGEFFIPSQNGAIVPASQMRSGGVTWNITINHPQQSQSSVLDDIRLAQRLAASMG